MFTIEQTPGVGPFTGSRYVVDHERGAWLQFVSGHGTEPGASFHLVWGGRSTGFNVEEELAPDGDGYVSTISGFGHNVDVRRILGIEQRPLYDEQKRRESKMLAAEALLVYGGYYNGLDAPDGKYRVRFGPYGRTYYTLSTFGYA